MVEITYFHRFFQAIDGVLIMAMMMTIMAMMIAIIAMMITIIATMIVIMAMMVATEEAGQVL